eukprot:Tbor_TRINITY_DN5611_c0_g2::TRINITY_DN5611_c0_g2_i3::g.9081::m.9081/K08515/VAMP7; vesicle-associated membrane protein 7
MADQGILYAIIANSDGAVVCDVARVRGNYNMNAMKVLGSIPRMSRDKRCISYDNYLYNFIGDGVFIYMCVTHESFSRVTAFNFLNAIMKSCSPGMNKPTERHQILKRDTDFYSDPQNDKITKIKTDIAQVKEVMIDNIEKILERGEKIDTLVDKTESLQFEAQRFETSAKTLKWNMWKKRIIITAVVIIVIFFVLFIIVLVGCSKDGVNFKKCGQK